MKTPNTINAKSTTATESTIVRFNLTLSSRMVDSAFIYLFPKSKTIDTKTELPAMTQWVKRLPQYIGKTRKMFKSRQKQQY
jgi:hypothetical protein